MSREFVILVAVSLVACARAASTGSAAKCDESTCALRHLHHYYEELDCKPVKEEGECCPTSYDCSQLAARDKSKCYFKGKALDVKPAIGEIIPGSCLAGCFCRQTKEAGAVATLTCAQVECPTDFVPSLIPEGCVATFSGEKCCSDGVLCQQNVTAETAKCEWGGKTYLQGQKFWPEEEPCKQCICQKGFDGTLNGPWCRQVDCGFELHYAKNIARGCAPVFLDQSKCCPIEWRCPEEDDTVVAAATIKNPAVQSTCKWGGLTLKQGDSVAAAKSSGSGPCKRCRCDVPPHVTCDSDGKPCDASAPAVAAEETTVVVGAEVPASAVEEAKRRPKRGTDAKDEAKKKTTLSCADKKCVTACLMVNGKPECV